VAFVCGVGCAGVRRIGEGSLVAHSEFGPTLKDVVAFGPEPAAAVAASHFLTTRIASGTSRMMIKTTAAICRSGHAVSVRSEGALKGGHKDRTLRVVVARADAAESLCKADFGSLVMWKRITASARWAGALGMTPDTEVQAVTGRAWALANGRSASGCGTLE
jgi:hypothetical protein